MFLFPIAIFWASVASYFVPTIVAHARRHPNAGAITVLNVFAGWTVVGWIVAIVWASTKVEDPRAMRVGSIWGMLVAIVIAVPAVLGLLGLALDAAKPAGRSGEREGTASVQSETPYTARKVARIESWARESAVVAGFVQGGELKSAGVRNTFAYAVVGPRFTSLTTARADSVIGATGRDLARRTRSGVLFVFDANDSKQLGIWTSENGFRRPD